jgi:hypothetical protein
MNYYEVVTLDFSSAYILGPALKRRSGNFEFNFTLEHDPILVKPPISFRMNKPIYNDQAHIAEDFNFIEEHTAQTSRLAFYKINSYKISLIKASFNSGHEAMSVIIRKTLLNYTDPATVLANLGFFDADIDN